MATIERAVPVGGASLNFKVVGGTSEPANPKENTIWVNTDAEITGWAFAADEPAAPVHGSVWIKTATTGSGAFNALKKNAINICPSLAFQWQTDKWVDRKAKIYQSGVWADWVKYLYDKGDECTSITGGWTNVNGMSGYTNTGTYTDNGDSYTLTITNQPTVINRITINKVDLSEVSKICVRTLSAAVYYDILVSNSNTNITTGRVASVSNESRAPGTLCLDVSSLSGSYYVAVRHINGAAGGNTGSVTVSQIWME